jgi:hypothetical protein
MFAFVPTWAGRAIVPIKLLDAFLVILTISNLFLAGMLLSLGELPEAPRLIARATLGFASSVSLVAAVAILTMSRYMRYAVARFKRARATRPSYPWGGVAAYLLLATIQFCLFDVSWGLVGFRTTLFRFFGSLLDRHIEAVVLGAIGLGCVLSLLTGVLSTLAALPPQSAQHEWDSADGES